MTAAQTAAQTPAVFIPALLCDAQLYRDVIPDLGAAIEAQVMLSPKPQLEGSVADILARAPSRFSAPLARHRHGRWACAKKPRPGSLR